jgi:hypothetical protein
MDIHCATCNEPWDTHHIRHDAVHETPAGLDWLNWDISMEEWAEEANRAGYFVTYNDGKAKLVKAGKLFFNVGPKEKPKKPPEPHAERWEGKLTAFWRAQFKLDGWEFGASLNAVLRCPCCRDAELPDAEERRARVQVLSELCEGDDDAIAADNELALSFK